MKKFLAVLGLLLSFCVNADELIIQQSVVNLDNKPTDDEIRATIEKYDFDKKQKEVLFKQMKKQIDEMYETGKSNCPKPDYIEHKQGIVDSYIKDMKRPTE